MRILQVSSARHFGGGERHLVDLIAGLTGRGHDVFVAVAEGSPLLPELSQISDQRILRLPFRKPFDIATAWKLRRFGRECGAEIIHAHMARDYPLAVLAASKERSPRLVITRHVLFPMGKVHQLTRRRVARVIAVSNAVAGSLRSQRIFAEDQIALVRHGIDLGRFRNCHRSAKTNRLQVGMLGELSPVKGQIEFVQAAQIIASRRDEVDFVIAGQDHSADGAYARRLRQMIAGSSLDRRIQLVESTVDLGEFLSRLDLFVSASHSEAFGLAIVDAMACNVAVVATATGGASEIITDGETGRLTPMADAESLANTIVELLDDAQQRGRLAVNARKMIAERFTLPRMVAETEAVYRAVLPG